jgi:motility quorum-sensing regulator/GCU-specific mRNA interferase toxin
MMEKRWPTYDLEAINLAIGSGETPAMTTTALRDATAP